MVEHLPVLHITSAPQMNLDRNPWLRGGSMTSLASPASRRQSLFQAGSAATLGVSASEKD